MKPPFESVVARHGATVLRVARAVLGHADADDAWSETFLAAMKAYTQLPADANVEAWLVTIAHRKAIDITRAAARHAVPVADTPDSPPPPPRGTSRRPRSRPGCGRRRAATEAASGRGLPLSCGPALLRDRDD